MPTVVVGMTNEEDAYGLWMVVERKSQRILSKQRFEEENLGQFSRGSRFYTLVSLDKDEEVIADDGEKSKGFKSKGYEIIVNFNLGVSNKGGSAADRLTRELGSKFSQVGHVKVDGLPGLMDSDNFVDGSAISGWIVTSSSMSLSNLSVLENAPNQNTFVKPVKILIGASRTLRF
ncbi:hypothetical protein GOBAR_DD07784 [Gossypium barbadense]|nr:hypothetical protein GOBAR_DD07784 [Gossypium barbadense]